LPGRREETGPVRCDIAIIGAGAAVLSLAWRLLCPPRGAAPSAVLVDASPARLRPLPRTWCHRERGPGEYDAWLTASWRRVRLHGSDGCPVPCDLGALRHKTLTSESFTRDVRPRLAALVRIEAAAEGVADGPDGAIASCRAAARRAPPAGAAPCTPPSRSPS
ncbi:lycopene cyclase family protein, partial [Streptomyces sp. NRRL B-24572]|uniref:lycopene cyclase family protein n=1 Tax=Streptomyces sp. NRRL B-24572 TaxID=1962156 RepID=UPI00358FAF69